MHKQQDCFIALTSITPICVCSEHKTLENVIPPSGQSETRADLKGGLHETKEHYKKKIQDNLADKKAHAGYAN